MELRRAVLDAIAASMRLEGIWWLWRRWLNWLTHGGGGSRIVIMMKYCNMMYCNMMKVVLLWQRLRRLSCWVLLRFWSWTTF